MKMNKPDRGGLLALAVLLLASLACSQSAPQSAPPPASEAEALTAQAMFTEGAATVMAGVTATGSAIEPALAATASSEPPPIPSATAPAPALSSTPYPTATSAPQPTATLPAATLPPAAQAVFTDNFAATNSGWASGAVEGRYQFGYTQGSYRMAVLEPYVEIWSIREQQLADIRLEVELTLSNAAGSAYGGVICRWQDTYNYYRFVVTADGAYAVVKRQAGKETELLSQAPGSPPAYPLRLAGECRGETLRLYVNGGLALEGQDTAFSEGAYGLVTGTGPGGRVTVVYDNFALYEP
jgi:hypothetical protein